MSKTQSPSYHGHSRIISAETPGSSPQRNENHRLKKENVRLRNENEQLRRIFDDAVDQFNGLKKKVEELERELGAEKAYRKELEKQNQRLEKKLRNAQAKANKFADMLFGLKSEKLKLSDIKVVNENTLVINETDGTGDDDKKKASGKKDRKKKKKGARDGHRGNGRKIPEGLPVVDTVIALPEGEIIHGISAYVFSRPRSTLELGFNE